MFEKAPVMESESDMALQCAFLTRNLERSAAWWARITGQPLGEVWSNAPREVTNCTYKGEPIEGIHRQVILRYKGMFIELIEPDPDEKNVWNDWLDAHGEGFHHIGFRIPNMAEGRRRLEEAGYSTLQTGNFPGGQYLYSDTESDGDFIVELLWFEPDFGKWLEDRFPAN